MSGSSSFFLDLRQTILGLGRAKAVAAVLLLSLALGTGVNATVYSVLRSLLLRPPAGIGHASRLVDVYTSEFSGTPYGLSSYPDFVSIKSGVRGFAAVAAIDDNTVTNVRLGESEQSARIARVSEDFFTALEMTLRSGRALTSDDALPGRQAAVVSLALAEHLADADAIVGKTLTIGQNDYPVVGVAAPRFRGLRAGRECDVWIPLTSDSLTRGRRSLSLIARLADGVSIGDGDADLGRLSDALATQYPETNRGRIGQPDAPRKMTARRYSALGPVAAGQLVLIAVIVGGASVLLLSSACLNLGSLLLSRSVARRHEFAIKMALGATRGRLARQVMIEALCVSIAGGALGLLFAIWTARAIPALFMVEQAELLDTRLDATVILLTLGVSCLAAASFGIAPAVQGTASPAVTALRGDPGGVSEQHGGGRLRAYLVAGQVALSAVLLLAAGLLSRSITAALEGDQASAMKRVSVLSIELPGRFADTVRGVAVRDTLLDRMKKIDGVDAVGWASTLPLAKGNLVHFQVPGASNTVTDTVDLDTNVVTTGYFRAMGLPLIEGRWFDARDSTRATPVVIVDALAARRYFGAHAIGQHLIDASGTPLEIVGIVQSGTYRTLQQPPQPTVYYPSTQDYLWRGHLVLRTSGDPAALLPIARTAIEGMLDGGSILDATTLQNTISASLALDRLTTTLIGAWGVIALVMSAIGVYGVMSDAVQRRTREIGLRLALGAGRRHVARLVFMNAAYLAIVGLSIGTAAAVAMTRVSRSIVDGVPSLDVTTLGGAAAILVVAIAIAAVAPLVRAFRVNPNVALRVT